MKKVIFGLAVVAAAAFGVYTANKADAKAQMSDLQSENVEALGEVESFKNPCKDNKLDICIHWDGSAAVFARNRR
jgi:hypothetical protein